jgi:preprotein translocase subunit YajC
MIELAYAMGQIPGGGGGGGASSAVTQILFFAAIFAIFYFLLIRPQQRQKREKQQMLSAIKKGDRVVTSGGIHGTIVGLNENTVVLRIAEQVRMEVDRTAIGRVQAAPGDKESA